MVSGTSTVLVTAALSLGSGAAPSTAAPATTASTSPPASGTTPPSPGSALQTPAVSPYRHTRARVASAGSATTVDGAASGVPPRVTSPIWIWPAAG
ncbi:MAG TPA: hypothetical protein DEP66_05880 [Acidimicrobiaceae bacterium]|nr:hypothetical protein [Acidimicrobiaceae bacterium]